MGAYIKFGKTEISAGFFLVLAVMMYLDTECLILMFAVSAFLHEIGHIFMIKVSGGSIERLRFKATGAEVKFDYPGVISNALEVMIYLSGPVVNVLVALISSFLSKHFVLPELLTFAGVNLILGLFNLLPIKMLDGGEVLRALSLILFGREIFILDILHYITTLLLFALCLALTLNFSFNLTLFLATLWVLTGIFRERHHRLWDCKKAINKVK